MTKEKLSTVSIPDSPGVYFFLGARKKILYIGKATSLRTRVRSYFDNAIREKRSALIEKMVSEANEIDWIETDSVLEALLLEANLIRTHKPDYNTRTKDDKSYNHVVITREAYPRVLIVRGKDLVQEEGERLYSHIFGPFPNGTQFKTAMRLIRRLFQFYDNVASPDTRTSKLHKGKLDFNVQIGLYPKEVTEKAYARTIRHIRLLFEGKKKQIIKELEREMNRCARKEAFEEAHIIKKKIYALKHIQDVALIRDDVRDFKDDQSFRIEAYDVAHLQGDDMVGAMVVIDRGVCQKSKYRAFTIRSVQKANDIRALKEVLVRRFSHTEWEYPRLIVVDGNEVHIRTAENVLKEISLNIPVVAVVKDEHHKPKDVRGDRSSIQQYNSLILLANAEAHRFAISLHKRKRRKHIRIL